MDLEEAWPARLSYNSVKFQDISLEEVQTHRMIWLPWLRVQVTYHTIHCVLNHPGVVDRNHCSASLARVKLCLMQHMLACVLIHSTQRPYEHNTSQEPTCIVL